MASSEGITCVIITKNEERNISRCLESVIGIADEIIVVDSFSTDKTEEICKKFGVKFTATEWKGYAVAKNYGNSLASNACILSLDADEALSESLKEEIRNLKTESITADGYKMNRLTNYCGKWIKHCGWYPDTKLRFWKKEKGNWRGYIHEQVVLEPKSTTACLKGDILHYTYYSINEHLQQIIKFTDMMAHEIYLKGKRPSSAKLVLSPITKFMKSFILQKGYLDGFYGFVICSLSSYATLIKYIKARELFRKGIN